MNREIVSVLQELAVAFPDCGIEAFNTEGILILKGNDRTRWHMARDNHPHEPMPVIDMQGEWYKLTIAHEAEDMPRLIEYLRPRLGNMETAFSEPYFYDIVNPGVSKGSCLKILAQHLKILDTNTVAVGDYDNDVEIIQAAAYGVAVGNATERVRQAASYFCADCDHDAIADLVERLPQIMSQ